MSLADIRTALKTKLETVSGIGVVNDFVVWSDDWDSLISFFVVDGRVHTWQIGIGASNPNDISRSGLILRPWRFNIIGLYTIKTDQESSKTFENICESILNVLSTSKNVLSISGIQNEAPNLITFENEIFIGTPVHRALIEFNVMERIAQDFACNG